MKNKPGTLTEKAVLEIMQRISASDLQPGDVLDTETNLAEELGISRNIIREAVNRLRGLGILESRQRQGLIIRQADPAAVFGKALPFFAVDELSISELAELRYCLEIGAVELAAERASPEQIARLRELAQEYAEQVGKDTRSIDVDTIESEFHGLILAATGNAFLSSLYSVIANYFLLAPKHVPGWYNTAAIDTYSHLAIADAIARRDGQGAQSILRGHLLKTIRKPEDGRS